MIQHKMNVTVPVTDESYENCNLTIKVKSVRHKTILMYYNETLNESELSEDITLQIMTTTKQQQQQQQQQQLHQIRVSKRISFLKTHINLKWV